MNPGYPMINAMNHITLAVKDVDRSFAFYRDLLGLTTLAKWDKGAYFLIGDTENVFWFCLNFDEKTLPSSDYTHYAFSVDKQDFELMAARIINSGTRIFKENTSPGESLYFLDPDGHKLEIHAGNWRDRIAAKKADIGNWKNVEWFI
jgi:catechol 2,3-dioxygenase-like lactoylglutathione lyase family enzyme